MRLKTLRKNRPPFEVEGAVVNGNRMDLTNNILKPVHHRSNTSFVLPTSLNTKISYPYITPLEQIHEISMDSLGDHDNLTASQSSNMSSYRAIQAAYLQHGIRIRLSSRKAQSATRQKPERKSPNYVRPQTAHVRQNSGRQSNVLHDITIDPTKDHDTGSYSTLQQVSSNDFEQIHSHNPSEVDDDDDDKSSSPVNEEIYDDNYYSSTFITSEHFHPGAQSYKLPFTNSMTCTRTTLLDDDDPDIMYMSSLLKIASLDSFRDTSRRSSAIRRTFSARPCSLTDKSTLSKQNESGGMSPMIQRNSLTRSATITAVPSLSLRKVDKDILKHASRIRNQSKDYSTNSFGIHSNRINSASTRDITTPNNNNNNRRNSNNKPLKSNSQEPSEHIQTSLSIDELPSTRILSITRKHKTSTKHIKSIKIPTDENQNTTNSVLQEHSISPPLSNKGNLSLMRTSPLNLAPQSNLVESSWHEHSSSIGDGQSLASSSIAQVSSSIRSGQLTQSATRRTNKKVSFYEEPLPVVLTTTTTTTTTTTAYV